MGVEALVRHQMEVGDQAIHRAPASTPSYQPDATEFHIDNTMRFVRAEIACQAGNRHDLYVSVKNTDCRFQGIRWSTAGAQTQGYNASRSTNWQNAVLLGQALVAVTTVEVFSSGQGPFVGRITAASDFERASIMMHFSNYDPIAGFDLAVMLGSARDAFVMSYHIHRES